MREASGGMPVSREQQRGHPGQAGRCSLWGQPTAPVFARGTPLPRSHTGIRAMPESRVKPGGTIPISGRDTRVQSPRASPAGVGRSGEGTSLVCASGCLGRKEQTP